MRERQFDTGEVEINYAVGPSHGPPFVLLHGGAGRWQYGQTLLELLESRWHVFAPDFRGHGRSGHVSGAYMLRDYVGDVACFLMEVVGEPAIVYGHSLGGEVGVMLAADYPQLLRGLIVGDAPLSTCNHATEEPAHRGQNELWHRLTGQPVAEIAAALRAMPVLVPGEAHLRAAEDVFGVDSPWFELHALSLHLLDPNMLAAVLAGPEIMLAGYDPDLLLPAISCPVLLLQADPREGAALHHEDVAMGLKLIKHATHVRIEGIGHSLHGPPAQTRTVLQAIMPFIDNVR